MTRPSKTISDLTNKAEENVLSSLTVPNLELFKNFKTETDELWQRFPDKQNRILEYANTNNEYTEYLKSFEYYNTERFTQESFVTKARYQIFESFQHSTSTVEANPARDETASRPIIEFDLDHYMPNDVPLDIIQEEHPLERLRENLSGCKISSKELIDDIRRFSK